MDLRCAYAGARCNWIVTWKRAGEVPVPLAAAPAPFTFAVRAARELPSVSELGPDGGNRVRGPAYGA